LFLLELSQDNKKAWKL